jgi:hypothetical protein
MRYRNQTFMEPWITPVYRAQCRTWNKAKAMLNEYGDVTRCDIEAELRSPSLRFSFRYLPKRRPADCIAFRRLVANAIRLERNEART